MPQVSIIIPTYNRARYVTKAIDSVLAQTYKDYEIIVVDDGSKDDTREALKPYIDKIRYIYQENAGVSAARNTGIRAAKGEWVAFLDSDDEWLPEKLAVQMDCVLKHPEIVAHVTNAKIVLSDDKSVDLFTLRGSRRYGIENPIIKRPLIDVFRFQFFTSSLMAHKKELADIGGLDESMHIREDADIMRRLSLEGLWGVSNQCLVVMIRRDESPHINLSIQSKTRRIYSFECLVRGSQKLIMDKRLNAEERKLVRRYLSGARFNLGISQLKAGEKQAGLTNIRQSFFDNPSVKSFVKYAVIRSFGTLGIKLIEKKRSLHGRQFRRSDFY